MGCKRESYSAGQGFSFDIPPPLTVALITSHTDRNTHPKQFLSRVSGPNKKTITALGQSTQRYRPTVLGYILDYFVPNHTILYLDLLWNQSNWRQSSLFAVLYHTFTHNQTSPKVRINDTKPPGTPGQAIANTFLYFYRFLIWVMGVNYPPKRSSAILR